MNKGKSLSDSSTSESEDDGNKVSHQRTSNLLSFYPEKNLKYSNSVVTDASVGRSDAFPTAVPPTQKMPFKRKFNAEGNEYNKVQKMQQTAKGNFKRPMGFREVDSSTSESEDDYGKKMFQSNVPSTLHNANLRQKLSSSESDDRSSAERTFPTMSSLQTEGNSTVDSPLFGGIGGKLMSKMGWMAGEGLGKHGQGRTEIVEASKQRGRRGLGLHIKGLEPQDVKWNSERESESVEESISWMPKCLEPPPSITELREWEKEGKKKLSIDDETEFCDPDVLHNIIAFKNVFDELEPDEMRKARTRSNPFETIRGGIFLNRAAMKMANIDSCFDFMFTDPKNQDGSSMVGPDELLYFADICAGPGGFSEYVLWRRKWECKGFGFTLRGDNDFKLDEFFSGPPETFEPHYGINGLEGDGNIYVPHNLREFRRFVLANTENNGVHFVMADGGFSVDGQENLQEILSKRLYLCQFLCALMIVRIGGHFVCKLFDLFTPFSVGLVYLMFRAFENVCLHKPNTSRPANSERYIICKWRKANTRDICDYMFELNDSLEKLSFSTSESDIVEVVPLDILKGDKDFFQYIVNSNNVIGERQIVHLDKIRAFTQNLELHEPLQSDFRKRCLAAWNVPDKARHAPSRPEPAAKFRELLRGENMNYLENQPEMLTEENLNKLENIFNFKCVVCGEITSNSYRGFFISLGRSNVYQLDFKSSKWVKVGVMLELPADTLFYGELIPELKGEGKAQKRVMCLQVIDALFLGARDVRGLHFEERMCLARKLAKAVSKPSRSDYTPIKVKEVWQLTELDEILNRLMMKNVKGYGGVPRLCFETEDERHFIPSGLLIFQTVALPWVTAYSKSQKRIYYFNTKNKRSMYERLNESAANFMQCFTKRTFWSWEKGVQLLPDQRVVATKSVVDSSKFRTFIREKLISTTGQIPKY